MLGLRNLSYFNACFLFVLSGVFCLFAYFFCLPVDYLNIILEFHFCLFAVFLSVCLSITFLVDFLGSTLCLHNSSQSIGVVILLVGIKYRNLTFP